MQPYKAIPCHSQGLIDEIDEVIRESCRSPQHVTHLSHVLDLLLAQQLSAYTSEWIVFKSNLKDTIKAWIKHPNRNKGENNKKGV